MNIVTPATEAELAEFLAANTSALRIQGGGTRPIGRVKADTVLKTTGLTGISLYEPGALTMVAKAGTPLHDIEVALQSEKQRLAFEPMDHRGLLDSDGAPTIGSIFAGNISGPRRIQAGAARDFALGLRFVDGAGTILKNGGRVMKNVTGYDLVKLLCGSWGTLGVVSEISLKTQPVPETVACVLINGLETPDAVACMSRALGSPFDVTGAAHAPSGVDGHPVTMLRLEGFEKSVSYRAGKLRDIFKDHDVLIETDQARVKAGWEWVRDARVMEGLEGDLWRISCKPSDAPELARKLNAQELLFDWGGGLVWALMPEGANPRDRIVGFTCHATRIKGQADAPVFEPETAGVSALTEALRRKFDPKGLLNPGILTR